MAKANPPTSDAPNNTTPPTLDLDGGGTTTPPPATKPTASTRDSSGDETPEGQTPEGSGEGPGGRRLVRVETNGKIVERKPRQGDQDRPCCPRCSTAKIAVLCGARGSTGMTTNYYCPTCKFSAQRLKPAIKAKLVEQRKGTKPPNRPFVERP